MFSHPLLYSLLLHHVAGLGPARMKLAMQQIACHKTLLQQSEQFWVSGVRIGQAGWQQIRQWQSRAQDSELYQKVTEDLQWLAASAEHHILSSHCPLYPESLKNIFDPPLVLYLRGDVRLLSRPQIAIVGARQATRSGLELAYTFAKSLAQQGWVITSGLALGIDGAAHKGCTEHSLPTIAVLGCGVNVSYPKRHTTLSNVIAEQGLLVSEFSLNTQPRPGHFPQRNRIISGLCQAILVVEAAEKSGSLITAQMALDEGRDIYAIPGSIHNPWARGCHQLIQNGARLVMDVSDMMEDLPELMNEAASLVSEHSCEDKSDSPELSDERRQVINAIDYEPTPLDAVIERSGLNMAVVMEQILHLEISGHVAMQPGGYCLMKH